MQIPLLEMDGTAEEIQKRLSDFTGQLLHVTVLPIELSAAGILKASSLNQSIEAKLQALASEIPPEERSKLPSDLNENLDHYIYGLPKKYAAPMKTIALPIASQ